MADSKKNKSKPDTKPKPDPKVKSDPKDDSKDASIDDPSKVEVKSTDMTDEMKTEAVEVAKKALAKNQVEKEVAELVKTTFDEKYEASWQCIVGRNFGCFVTHEEKAFIYFTLGQVEKEVAALIKKDFDERYEASWQCIVGRNFGCFVTHEEEAFIYFTLGQVAVLLFKAA